MKKIVLMVAVVACVAFASQGVQASTVQVSVENVMQDDFVKIEVKGTSPGRAGCNRQVLRGQYGEGSLCCRCRRC